MKGSIVFSIPPQLAHPFFFSHGQEIQIDHHSLFSLNPSVPFLYEAAFFSDMESYRPWERLEESIPVIMEEWGKNQVILKGLFEKRDKKNTGPPMRKGIALFLEFLYWTNGYPVSLKENEKMEEMKIHPVNVKERLEFILNRPSLYHSFVQLSELMSEMEKQYVKYRALRKVKAPKH